MHPNDRAPSSFALIIGAMKSGTTSVYHALASHPEICECKEKEPGFFSNPSTRDLGLDAYRELWDWDGRSHKVALEASTGYAKYPWVEGVPESLARLTDADFRFIYMVRHPVRRIASQVRHSLYGGWGKSLDDELTEDLIDFSRYAEQLDQYTRWFPSSSILVVALEQYRKSPSRVLQQICRFLEIDDDFAFPDSGQVLNRGAFFEIPPAVAAIAKTPVVKSVIDRLPDNVRQKLRDVIAQLFRRGSQVSGESRGRWQPTAEEEAAILQRLRPDLRRLQDEWDVPVEEIWSIRLDTDHGRGER